MENQSNKLNIEFVKYMGYFIPKTDVEGFNPETNGMLKPSVDEKVRWQDETCQQLGYFKF